MERRTEFSVDEPGYDKAIALVRSRNTGIGAVAEALGDASPNGPQGNVWKLLDQRYATTRIGRGLFTEDSLRHDVLEVRGGTLLMRPGSPLARLFAAPGTEIQSGAPRRHDPVSDRDVPILGIFYSDGIISFAGDADDMTTFRDMAAKVVGAPGSRSAD